MSPIGDVEGDREGCRINVHESAGHHDPVVVSCVIVVL
jgi:hypothetical protein